MHTLIIIAAGLAVIITVMVRQMKVPHGEVLAAPVPDRRIEHALSERQG